jgi:hypothetical protein
MSTDMHKRGHHGEGEYEHQDLSAAAIFGFLIALVVLGILIQFVISGTLHLFEKYNAGHQPRQNPLVQSDTETRKVTPATIEKFPQPRLEDSERRELRDFREHEIQTLNSYGVDQSTGATRIPIEQAMQLIVQRGLPTKPQAGTAPQSVVNTVNQAAAKADTSDKTAAKKSSVKK